MPIVSVLSLKGGVGKTSVVLGLAGAATVKGLATLVIDLDPQGNATSILAAQKPKKTAADVLAHPTLDTLHEALTACSWEVAPGEVDGICESLDSVIGKRPNWIKDKVVTILFQGGAEPNPELKDIPFVLDLAKTEQQKAELRFLYAGQGIGRPFVAPPDLPADRLKMLRDAFNATMKDPEFIEEVKKQKLDLEPEDGPHLEALIKQIYSTPKPIVDKIGKLIQ
jgi:hypothetical protein